MRRSRTTETERFARTPSEEFEATFSASFNTATPSKLDLSATFLEAFFFFSLLSLPFGFSTRDAMGTTSSSLCFCSFQTLIHNAKIRPAAMPPRALPIGAVNKIRRTILWLRDNTPEDSRIMAWWDYGYQITGIANRTTIADGNTWNHEHIALLGKALTTDVDTGYEIARHIADYVLVWGGGGGDDLAKSPHLARIANSVYRDHCPGDPTCREFGFIDREGTPSPMMGRSFLYKLHGHKIKPGVEAPADKFQEVYRSKYGKVRIYKLLGVSDESKKWVADQSNRLCDVPGSWFCPGQYPPGLERFLNSKKDFAQLEDFNRKSADDEYQKQYFENLNSPEKAKQRAREKEMAEERAKQQAPQQQSQTHESSSAPSPDVATTTGSPVKLVEDKQKRRYNNWQNGEESTQMWKLIDSNNIEELKAWMAEDPSIVFVRSEDGRGPMWWAFENRRQEIVKILMDAGVPHTDKDSKGQGPIDLLEGQGM